MGVITNRVDVMGTAFVPPEITVLNGTKVTWTNRDEPPVVGHTVSTDENQIESFNQPLLPATAPAATTFEFTFDEEGTIRYHCNVHSTMHGVVHVVASLPAAPVGVSVLDNKFDPKDANVTAGQSVNWTHNGNNLHSITFESAAVGDLGDIRSGQTLVFVFETAGTYRYRCKYHSPNFDSGMVGKVAVQGATGGPPTVAIHRPASAAHVNGTVAVEGNATDGAGNATVSLVEVRIGANGSWSAANGTHAWSYRWDTRSVAAGPMAVFARAHGGGFTSEEARRDVVVDAPASLSPAPTSKKSPAPGLAGTLLAAIGLALAFERGSRRWR